MLLCGICPTKSVKVWAKMHNSSQIATLSDTTATARDFMTGALCVAGKLTVAYMHACGAVWTRAAMDCRRGVPLGIQVWHGVPCQEQHAMEPHMRSYSGK